jgi:hypothetical protein
VVTVDRREAGARGGGDVAQQLKDRDADIGHHAIGKGWRADVDAGLDMRHPDGRQSLASPAVKRASSSASSPPRQAPILALPLVEGRAADPVLAADIRRLRIRLLLPQDPDDLLFREL